MPIKKTIINAASRAAKAASQNSNNAAIDKTAKAADITTKTVAAAALWKVWLILAIILVVVFIVGCITGIALNAADNINAKIGECSAGNSEAEVNEWIESSGVTMTEEQKQIVKDANGTANCKQMGTGYDGFAYPPSRGRMSAQFNEYRTDPPRYHQGMDIAGACNDPIYAFAGGEVIKVVMGSESKSGNTYVYPMGEIIIQHTPTFKTRYLHMAGSSTTVAEGDIVSAGQQIATQWSNGPSTGCHLHIEAYEDEKAVDMNKYLEACGFIYTSSTVFNEFPEGPIACGAGGDESDIKTYAKQQIKEIAKVSDSNLAAEFQCLDNLWVKESNWNPVAINPAFSPSQPNEPEYQAYGIPQGAPGSKMASEGADWKTNPQTQVRWGLKYIAGRYGTPCSAWAHSVANNWY